jgi:hypothetical protein
MAVIQGDEYAIEILSSAGIQEVIIDDAGPCFEIAGTRFYYNVTMTEEDDLVFQFTCPIAENVNPTESLLRAVAYKNPTMASVALDEQPDKSVTLVINADLIVGWNKDADITAVNYILRSMHSQVLDMQNIWSRILK